MVIHRAPGIRDTILEIPIIRIILFRVSSPPYLETIISLHSQRLRLELEPHEDAAFSSHFAQKEPLTIPKRKRCTSDLLFSNVPRTIAETVAPQLVPEPSLCNPARTLP